MFTTFPLPYIWSLFYVTQMKEIIQIISKNYLNHLVATHCLYGSRSKPGDKTYCFNPWEVFISPFICLTTTTKTIASLLWFSLLFFILKFAAAVFWCFKHWLTSYSIHPVQFGTSASIVVKLEYQREWANTTSFSCYIWEEEGDLIS